MQKSMLCDSSSCGVRYGTSSLNPLDGDKTDSTRSGMNKHVVHRAKPRLAHAVMRRDPDDRKRDGVFEGQTWRATDVPRVA